jgi:hypothetical protein
MSLGSLLFFNRFGITDESYLDRLDKYFFSPYRRFPPSKLKGFMVWKA